MGDSEPNPSIRELRLRALRSLAPLGVRHLPRRYLRSLLASSDGHTPYDARRFFGSFYGAAAPGELDDRYTVSPDSDRIAAKYHYNAVENSLFLVLRRFPPPPRCRVLDIGSGAGHWIDFYRTYYDPAEIHGIDIAAPAVEFLRSRYLETDGVLVSVQDVTDPSFSLPERFDLISAIGVLFHVVEDDRWETALRNLAGLLTDEGVLLVGGEFGPVTENAQFHGLDEFSSWEQLRSSDAPRALVNKRLRSLRMWRAAAGRAGLVIRDLQITKRQREIWTPQNNILVLSRRRGLA